MRSTFIGHPISIINESNYNNKEKNLIAFYSPVLLLGNTKFKFYLIKILFLLNKRIVLVDDLSDLDFESLDFKTFSLKDFNIYESNNFKHINPKSL